MAKSNACSVVSSRCPVFRVMRDNHAIPLLKAAHEKIEQLEKDFFRLEQLLMK